jgi:hypothetical protein
MKQLLYSFCILGVFSCKNPDKKSTTNSKTDSITQTALPKSEEKRKVLFTEAKSNTWYEGNIGKLPVWMYITYLEGTSISVWYGYESMNGAFIKMNGKLEQNQLLLNPFLPQESQKEEKFTGKINAQTGIIEGEWSMGTKKLPFVLELVNPEIPTNSKEFLNAFANLKAPLEGINSSTLLSEKLIKNVYQEKKMSRFIPNLHDFLESSEIKLAQKQGILIGKMNLSNGNYLTFFTCDIAKEQAFEVDSYQVKTEGMICAAILDKEGKLLATTILGNDGDDRYYMDFGFEVPSANQIKITWTFYMRGDGGARIEESSKKETILIKNNKFERKG